MGYATTNSPGAAVVQGTYTEDGTFGGKPCYFNGTVWLWWNDPVQWAISTDKALPAYYYTTDTADPEAATWANGMYGSDPQPIFEVTAGGSAFVPKITIE